ncbi:MAG: choice-of-anchor Q domain-containing protein, partial [Actinomycetota bacterium]
MAQHDRPLVTVRRAVVAVVALGVAVLMPAQPVQAATIVVNGFNDEFDLVSSCTLREAVRAANDNTVHSGCVAGSPGSDTIQLPAGTHTLSHEGDSDDASAGDLDITEDVSIVGAGAATTTIMWGSSVADPDRVFDVEAAGTDLTLSGVTIRDGDTDELGAEGGGIRTAADTGLTITDAVLTSNSAFRGGGVQNGGTGTFTRVTIAENDGGIGGGGIRNYGTLTLIDVSLRGNMTPDERGGGIENTGTLFVERSTISGNEVDGDNGSGGGVANEGTATLTNVTVTGNSVVEDGGGVFAIGGTTTLNNVTVAGNTADRDTVDGGDGGGIAVAGGATVNMRNTIVAGNTDDTGEAPDCSGTLTSQGHNLVQNVAGCGGLGAAGDLTGLDPMLGSLADNGGPTQTQALLAGSPAINAGGPDCAPTDQRGLGRNCDIGAYERVLCQSVPVNHVGTEDADALTGTAGPDGIEALGGKDVVLGLGGRDGLCLGPGRDRGKG